MFQHVASVFGGMHLAPLSWTLCNRGSSGPLMCTPRCCLIVHAAVWRAIFWTAVFRGSTPGGRDTNNVTKLIRKAGSNASCGAFGVTQRRGSVFYVFTNKHPSLPTRPNFQSCPVETISPRVLQELKSWQVLFCLAGLSFINLGLFYLNLYCLNSIWQWRHIKLLCPSRKVWCYNQQLLTQTQTSSANFFSFDQSVQLFLQHENIGEQLQHLKT